MRNSLAARRNPAQPDLSGGPVDEPTRGISQARRRLPANGQVHARSREQGDLEPDGGAMASLRRSVQEPARGRQAGETTSYQHRRYPALMRPASAPAITP